VSLRFFAALALVSPAEGGESFLGLPMWIWQLANLVAFLGVLG